MASPSRLGKSKEGEGEWTWLCISNVCIRSGQGVKIFVLMELNERFLHSGNICSTSTRKDCGYIHTISSKGIE